MYLKGLLFKGILYETQQQSSHLVGLIFKCVLTCFLKAWQAWVLELRIIFYTFGIKVRPCVQML